MHIKTKSRETILKAVVLKTSRLRETHEFFRTTLCMKIEESSVRHFVIFSDGIRILFVESAEGPEAHLRQGFGGQVELYLAQKSEGPPTVREDPNQIKIIIT